MPETASIRLSVTGIENEMSEIESGLADALFRPLELPCRVILKNRIA